MKSCFVSAWMVLCSGMSIVISAETFAGEPAIITRAECPKWMQPPDCALGVDVASWMATTNDPQARWVADDWLCDGRPVTAVEWWGSYIGWQTNIPGDVPPPPNRPIGFAVAWYSDIPASGTNFSRPGTFLVGNILQLLPFGETDTNIFQVSERSFCNSQLPFAGPNTFEHEYRYHANFENQSWMEKEGNVYWLRIQAFYAESPAIFPWGWKTTPVEWNYNDDGTVNFDFSTNELIYPPPGWVQFTNHPYAGQSVNMAFTLFSDICPSRCKKWSEPPDLILGDDRNSWDYTGILRPGPGTEGEITSSLHADDFISDGRPITDIHWWGSYRGWQNAAQGDELNPIPAPTGVDRPLAFRLNWYADNTNCAPGELLDTILVGIDQVHEVYYGDVVQFWNGEYFEHEYQYYVDLIDTNLGLNPWIETNGARYWLSIQALFDPIFLPSITNHFGWGWKKTSTNYYTGCTAEFSFDNGTNWSIALIFPPHPEGIPVPGRYDMAFELTTTNIPPTNTAVQVGFTNVLAHRPGNSFNMWTTGYCGCGKQVLQASTNLLLEEAGWFDVATNIIPRQANFWLSPPLVTQRFYRINQRD